MSIGTYAITVEWKAHLKQAILVTQAASLVGLWNIDDEDADPDDDIANVCVDHSGNDYHGTHDADVDLEKWGCGDRSTCPRYNGDGHTDTYSGGVAGEFNGALGSLTLAFQIPVAATLSDATLRYAVILAADGNNEIIVRRSTTNNTITVRYKAGGTSEAVNITVSDTAWHYVTITWNKADDRVRVYLDGSQSGSDQTGLGTWAGALASTACVIGASNTSDANPWKGMVEGVALHSCELTATEVANVHGHLDRFDDIGNDVLDMPSSFSGFADRFDSTARVGTMNLILDNGWLNNHSQLGLYSPSNQDSPLYGCLNPGDIGDLPRFTMTHTFDGTTYDLWAGWLVQVEPVTARHEVRLMIVDALHLLAETDVEIPLQESVRTDEAVQAVCNGVGAMWGEGSDRYARVGLIGTSEVGYGKVAGGAEGMNFQTAKETFDFVGDLWTGQVKALRAIRDLMMAEGGRVYAEFDGNLRLTNRTHEYADTTSQCTISGTMADVREKKLLDKTYSRVEVVIQPRVTDTEAVVGDAQCGEKPYKVPFRTWEHKNKRPPWVDIQYRAPDSTKLVGVTGVSDPVENVDYTINSEEDGSGSDYSEYVRVKFKHFATFTRAYLSRINKNPKPCWLTKMQITGTALLVDDKQVYTAAASARHPRTKRVDLKIGDDPDYAFKLAEQYLNEYLNPRPDVLVTLENLNDAQFTEMLDREVLDLVMLVETETGLNGDYRIMAIERRAKGAYMQVKWHCAPWNLAGFAIVGQAQVGVHKVAPF